jgi:hypothetical protein
MKAGAVDATFEFAALHRLDDGGSAGQKIVLILLILQAGIKDLGNTLAQASHRFGKTSSRPLNSDANNAMSSPRTGEDVGVRDGA